MALRNWLERLGFGTRRAAKLMGINRNTLKNYLNDPQYRKRCSARFHGRIGARVRHRLAPLVNHNNGNGIVRVCPYCHRPLNVN